ncbi:MAG: OmpA family protein [Candidatus Sulfopaludibacter sp.]|nr:OmpA family protein [Candidatus Sulfopaludibacter sp.]
MKILGPAMIALAVVTAGAAIAQNVPLYRVTVIERTVKAVNYQYRSGMPTQIDFRGTVLLPEGRGDATVESKAGRTDIDARFEHVTPPSRYGKEYLTYVLWAITPEGHAKNLGEVLAGSSDKAKLRVTTDLQAFGMIVTAEPYAAVRQPSDVVVMENEIRPDTVGTIEPINAKYDLLPRGQYTYDVPADLAAAEGNGKLVGMKQYEELLEIYQAQNAVQIARAMGADQYAADTLAKAQQLLTTAQNLEDSHSDRSSIVQNAREAAQTAEDARAITEKRKQNDEVAAAKAEAGRERDQRLKAEADAQAARAQASADRTQLEQERARMQPAATVSTQPALPPEPPPAPETIVVVEQPRNNANQEKRQLRINIYGQLGASSLETTDTPRGLLVTIPANDFNGRSLQPMVSGQLSRVASVIRAYPGLRVEVDDNGDSNSSERAEAVRAALQANGVPANAIIVRPVGNGRPVASNATPGGRELNRRVEIAISGDAIGTMPYWDRTYSLAPR